MIKIYTYITLIQFNSIQFHNCKSRPNRHLGNSVRRRIQGNRKEGQAGLDAKECSGSATRQATRLHTRLEQMALVHNRLQNEVGPIDPSQSRGLQKRPHSS